MVLWSKKADYERIYSMEPGESWGYRARGVDPLVEVRVLRHGDKRPSRVLIAFVDDAFEGKTE